MKWTNHHQKLLLALRAQQLIPKLHMRLTFERYVATEDDMRRLSAWPDALSQDPGWPRIEPVLDQPDAWPAAWHRATELGWSPKSDHHNALFFTQMTDRFASDEDYENALWSWTEAIGAWKRLMQSDYPSALLADLTPEADEDTRQNHQQTLRDLLSPLIEDKAHALRDALRLDDDRRQNEQIDKRQARFAWSALDMAKVILNDIDTTQDHFGILTHLLSQTSQKQETIRMETIARFERMVQALDLNEATGEALVGPFEWVTQVFEMLGANSHGSISIVEQVVDLGWSLRRLGLDDNNKDFEHILQITSHFNDDLSRRVKSLETFGHNAKCADFLVFKGELADTTESRKAIFERGLEICPGHRNSAMLLSYEYLNEAHALIYQLKLVPGTVSRTLSPSKAVEDTVLKAWAKVEQAEDVFPTNKELEQYVARVETTAKRLGVTLPPRKEEQT